MTSSTKNKASRTILFFCLAFVPAALVIDRILYGAPERLAGFSTLFSVAFLALIVLPACIPSALLIDHLKSRSARRTNILLSSAIGALGGCAAGLLTGALFPSTAITTVAALAGFVSGIIAHQSDKLHLNMQVPWLRL